MSWLSRLLNHARSNRLSRDIGREMRFHLDERADELIAGGMRPADARHEARRRFGSVALQAEDARENDLFRSLDILLRDLRYALRSMASAPAFTLVAVLSLALGIGANTAIFSIFNALILKSLPVSHPEELVSIVRGKRGDDIFTNPLWEAIRDRQDVFSGAFAFSSTSFNLAGGGEARLARGNWVSGDYFSTLGVRPELGRAITRADDYRGCPGIAMLSDGFWRSEYGGSAGAIGKTISLEGHPFEIVGVTDPRFFGTSVGEQPQVYVPLCARGILNGPASLDQRSSWYLQIIGRPKPGVTANQIRARLAALAPGIAESTLPQNWPADALASYRKTTLGIQSAARGLSSVRGTYTKAVYCLLVIVGLVLAVACANVANLLLARAASRQREMAVRLAIGASRGRLARQVITESLLLSALGAVLGTAFAVWGVRVLVGLMAVSGRGVMLDTSADGRVLGFTIAVAMVTGLLFGVVPAWRAGRVDPQAAMKAQGRGVAEGHSKLKLGTLLVGGQVALSLVLIAGAGLLLGSWRKLATLDPGFRRDGILLVSASIHDLKVPKDQRLSVYAQMLDRVRAIPGVKSASAAMLTPVGSMRWNDILQVDGFTPKSEDDAVSWMNAVSDGFFGTMGIPILLGRDFNHEDAATSQHVAIVSEAMARKFFGTTAIIGRRFRVQQGSSWTEPVEIVGVVADTKYSSLRDTAEAIVYYPQAQQEATSENRVLEIQTAGPPASVAPAVKSAIAGLDPRITLQTTTMEGQLADSMAPSRAIALLSGFFGALALLLASIGLYGIMAYNVARRRNEIGVRIALGAESARVVRMVLGEVGRIVIAGVLVGLALSAAATRLVQSFLYGVSANDPATFAASATVLLAVGLIAAAVPALRAARMDAVSALREE